MQRDTPLVKEAYETSKIFNHVRGKYTAVNGQARRIKSIHLLLFVRRRTVLLGNACHKLNPFGGASALTAIHDAVVLANWISTLHKPKLLDIEAIFAEYRAERLPVAKETVGTTNFFKSMRGKCIVAALSKFFSRHLPEWLRRIVRVKMMATRPQLSFLPLVEDKGSIHPKYQPSLEKTLAILKERAAKKQVEPTSTKSTIVV